MNLPKSCG